MLAMWRNDTLYGGYDKYAGDDDDVINDVIWRTKR